MPSSITVTVDADGQLAAQGYRLEPSDLADFAKDVGGRPVVIVPKGNPSYGKAVQAREQLKAAGVSNVILGDPSGG
jgi:biopolymer transport protein ExbD